MNVMAKVSEHLNPVCRVIKENETAKGLAIIIGNQRSKVPSLRFLHGPIADVYVMTNAFQRLKYAVLPLLNVSTQTIRDTIKDVTHYFPRSPKKLCYERFVFVFAGHGDDTDSIHTHDGVVDLQAEVIFPLLPQEAPHLQEIPKFFFIDACRCKPPSEHPVPRGGGDTPPPDRPPDRISSMANYMWVYSTYTSQEAIETNAGGDWMQLLAEEFCLPENLNKSVSEICINVNAKLRNQSNQLRRKIQQQPVHQDTLHKVVKFLEEAKELEGLYNTLPYTTN